MPDFVLTTLGCGSAKPSVRHQPSSTVLNYRSNLFMIDCGEGAQQAFQREHLKFSRLGNIFLTHMHGDHVFGLPGLLGTLALSGLTGSVTIHTFRDGRDIIKRITDYFCRDMPVDVRFNVIGHEEAVIYETDSLTVRTIPLKHRVPAVGYVFEQKELPRHIDRASCDYFGVPVSRFNAIKAGDDFITADGRVIPNERLTRPADKPVSYAHISDTLYMPEIAEKIGGVNLLFHETTYLEEHAREAREHFHSTARQAATVARDAGAGKLLTGHYSARYRDDSAFLKEAREVFPDVILNREGLRLEIT